MKIKFTQKNAVGGVIGFVSPILLLPLTIYILSLTQNYSFNVLWSKFLSDYMVMSKFLSLSIIGNLLWFYLFLNKERYEIARGVIIGSALHFPFIIYVNLIM